MRIRLTRQTWLALVSAVVFVTFALVIAVAPTPYVVYSPGRAYDLWVPDEDGTPRISIDGIPTFPVTGQLYMTTVAMTRADARVSLPEAVLAYWLPDREAMPRKAVYDPGKTSDQLRAEVRMMMDTSQQDAVVAALRAADVPVEQLPVVAAVTVSGPADGRLLPGDLILAVADHPVSALDEVGDQIRRAEVGEPIEFTIQRNGDELKIDVPTVASVSDPAIAAVGIEVNTGYRFAPKVNFGISHEVGGPSAGLVFALAIYDQISAGDLLAGRAVAGTGEIDANGDVRRIGGLREKVAGAERAQAAIFLVPADNCVDLVGVHTDLQIIPVATLRDAVQALESQTDSDPAPLPTC